MEHLFDAWEHILKKVKGSQWIVLLCDYDGTLTPIVERPEMAELSQKTAKLLGNLTHKHAITLGVVSGRALSDIKERVGLSGIIYAGNHGFEIEGPAIRFIHPLTEEVRSTIHIIGIVLKKMMSKISGTVVEDKGLSLSVHYRLVKDADLPRVSSIFENVVDVARKLGKIKTVPGKKVQEVRPAVPWDKGKAVQLIIEKQIAAHRKISVVPIYLGDDVTDEDAFRAISRYDGISVHIGDKDDKSLANYYLNDTEEVNLFLAEIFKIVS